MVHSAFNNDEQFKRQVLERAFAHQHADEYSVGCAIYDISKLKGIKNPDISSETFLAKQLNVPIFIATLQDAFFDGMSDELRSTWSTDFLASIKPGADLSPVLPKILLFALEKCKDAINSKEFKDQLDAINQSQEVLKNWIETGSPDRAAAKTAELTAQRSSNPIAWKGRSAKEAALWAARAMKVKRPASVAWRAEAAVDATIATAAFAVDRAESETVWISMSKTYSNKLIELIGECRAA